MTRRRLAGRCGYVFSARALASFLCTSALTGPAFAQQAGTTQVAAATPATQHANGIEEVVVTAEKRSATVQSAPLSITALSGAQLKSQGITNVMQVAEQVPGISLRTSGPGQTELEMRGMSSSGGSSPTVGFYLDETPLSPPAASLNGKVVIDPDLFDLNRVEVLRGPQGTLYGAGSMGGTIKLITNQPDLRTYAGDIDLTLSGTVHGGPNGTGKVMVNFPLVTDKLALRIVGTEGYVSGWTDRYVVNPFPNAIDPGPACPGWPGCVRGDVTAHVTQTIPDVNWEWQQSARASLLAKPIPDLSIDTSFMFQRITMGGYNDYDQSPGDSYLGHFQPFNIHEPFSDRFDLVSSTWNYDLDFATLTSATSYWTRRESQTQDLAESIYNLFQYFGFSGVPHTPVTLTETDPSHQFSEEIRLASSGEGRLKWLIGAFYSQLESIYNDTNEDALLAGFSTGGAAANPLGIIYNSYNPFHISQYAFFGEASYRLTDSVRLTAGLRYFSYSTSVQEQQSGIGTFYGNAIPQVASYTESASGITPKFNVSWEPDHDLTVYATAAKGFRPGGVNLPIPPQIGCALSTEVYGPDTAWDYELGEKARMFDSRLSVNADVYYITWSNIQQLINQPCGYPLTTNAGSAKSYGPEFELNAKLTPELTLTISAAYTHATLTSVNTLVTAAAPSLVPGAAILNIPRYTESTSLAYKRPLNDAYDFFARVTNSLVGPSVDTSYTREDLQSYDLIGARCGVQGDHWSGTFFIDNLTNKHAELSINTTSFGWVTPSLTRVATNLPLTVGVNVAYKF